ncbi:hypothetical protein NON20_25750 (plasmid) [Synechocystis sp. B12]|nr:hypothetical protein NON20_25750 [Synechocystis sp. B12]
MLVFVFGVAYPNRSKLRGMRNPFLDQWDWIFGIINWNKIFSAVYYRFKFCIAIVQKGGQTSEIKSAFSRYFIGEWENAEKFVMPYSRLQVEKFSPKSKSLLETRTQKVFEKF